MTGGKERNSIVVIGASAGGVDAIGRLLERLPEHFPCPIAAVQHLHKSSKGYCIELLDKNTGLTVKEGEDKEQCRSGFVYLAPPDYHMLLERDDTLSLSVDERVNYARPSIDILFESAALSREGGLIAVLLSGANEDGAAGLRIVRSRGGMVLIQDPASAEAAAMPEAALRAVTADFVGTPEEIGDRISGLTEKSEL